MSAIAGYALLWDDEAVIDGRPERFAPYSIAEPIVAQLMISHDGRSSAALTRTSSGLRIWQDDHGLAFSARLGDDRDARRALSAVRYGTLRHVSFGFRPTATAEDGGGVVVKQATLSEITLTGCPAYEAGAVWPADVEDLPPRLEALRQHWRACSTARRPSSIAIKGPQAARRDVTRTVDDPIRAMARAHVSQYMACCPTR